MLGLNRLNSRCLFIGDSANLTQNSANSVISLNPTGRFDCTSTDGSLRLPAVFNSAMYTNTTYNTTFVSSLSLSGLTTLNNATTCTSSLNVSGTTTFSNRVGINTTATNCNLEILGVANFHNGTRFSALNYSLNPGSLILGSTGLNYGGGTNWNGGNAAGLMM